ncbi:MAG: MurR/RpiR family transcriptional regulator [Woeseiaceae bacterium]|nr:MurR/RpiR family transcriptional regulator [Woeseiaceae bacterium]
MKVNHSNERGDGSENRGPRDRILAAAASFSRRQQTIADFVLERYQEVPFLSVLEIAERTGASEATVVRFCQRIGYSGYSDMKTALVDALRQEMQAASDSSVETVSADIGRDSLSAVAQLEQHNIRRLVEGIDKRMFRRVAATLFKADHIFTVGYGISAYHADFASYLFTEHGLRATCLETRFTSPREQLITLRPSDLVLAFSFPPYSKQTLEILEESKQRGIPAAVVTDRATAPSVPIAGHALIVSSRRMTFTNASAAIHVLLNALVVEIAERHRGETVNAISRINEILRDKHYLVDDDS